MKDPLNDLINEELEKQKKRIFELIESKFRAVYSKNGAIYVLEIPIPEWEKMKG